MEVMDGNSKCQKYFVKLGINSQLLSVKGVSARKMSISRLIIFDSYFRYFLANFTGLP
jgi:hypothetical protein